MIKQTAQQRANTLDALSSMWPSVPPENVCHNLDEWRLDDFGAPTCGTIACFGGWCAWWPAFVAQGVCADVCGIPVTAESGWGSDTSWLLFGYAAMFVARGSHRADDGFSGTDHELVTNRLRWLIAYSVVVNEEGETAYG